MHVRLAPDSGGRQVCLCPMAVGCGLPPYMMSENFSPAVIDSREPHYDYCLLGAWRITQTVGILIAWDGQPYWDA